MNLDPALGRIERIGSALMGAVLVAVAMVGNFDKPVVRGGLVLLGLAYVVGGIGGT